MVKYKKEKRGKKMARERREFTDEFKEKIVELHLGGKSQAELSRDYDLTLSSVNGWVKNFKNSGSFKVSDNRTEEEKRLIGLEKEVKQLRMENDILKQAALIMGRK